MENRIVKKARKVKTEFISANTRSCEACWECINACPKQVIGKVSFLWHKHIVIQNGDNCIGCKKCIKTCPQEVFSSIKKI